ncbi:MAG: bifunctional nuclease domain-containing protein, partial [Vulcanimicrobiaceae bacterium]
IEGKIEEIDARPSDGIALALRIDAPIYVTDKIVLEEASREEESTREPDADEMRKFKKFLDELKPSDFNK